MIIKTIAVFLMRYTRSQALREFILLLGSQGCSKSLILFLCKRLGGGYTASLDPSHISAYTDLTRRALINNSVRLHVVHEMSKMNKMLLKMVWAATDMADTRACHSSHFEPAPEFCKLLIGAQNHEDLICLDGSDVFTRAVVVPELDADGKRLLGKGCKTVEEVALNIADGHSGYFLQDPSIRQELQTDGVNRAFARKMFKAAQTAGLVDGAVAININHLSQTRNSTEGGGEQA